LADRRCHLEDFIYANTTLKSGLQAISAAMALLKNEVFITPQQLREDEVRRNIGLMAPAASAPGQSLRDNGGDRGSDNKGIDSKVEKA
jgi:hypothetical protein